MGVNYDCSASKQMLENMTSSMRFIGQFESLDEISIPKNIGRFSDGDVCYVGGKTYCYVAARDFTGYKWLELGDVSDSETEDISKPIKVTHCKQCGASLPVEQTDSTTGICRCSYCSSPNYVWEVTQ